MADKNDKETQRMFDLESDGRYVEFSEERADEDDREAQERARQADARTKK